MILYADVKLHYDLIFEWMIKNVKGMCAEGMMPSPGSYHLPGEYISASTAAEAFASAALLFDSCQDLRSII